MSLRIMVFAFDIPYPANRGGRADIWRRLVALTRLGCKVHLVCWADKKNGAPTMQELEVIQTTLAGCSVYSLKQGPSEIIKRVGLIPRCPSHVAARRLSALEFMELTDLSKTFDPDVIWIEGPYPGEVGRGIATILNKPFYYRSHNIEHLYMQSQAKASLSVLKRMALRFACIGLRKFELDLMLNARRVYDISSDDMAFWNEIGVKRISCLPPLPEAALGETLKCASFDMGRDVVFLGNLTTPNNLRGIEFLLTEVMPQVHLQRPLTRFTIAGSNPGDRIKRLISSFPMVELLENVPNAMEVMQSARVLVNPVRTGSGVMVKILDMLMTDLPIVSSSQGTRGLQTQVTDELIIADEPTKFASAIVDALETPKVSSISRKMARNAFSLQRVESLVEDLYKDIQS